jgi:hypothetical protein
VTGTTQEHLQSLRRGWLKARISNPKFEKANLRPENAAHRDHLKTGSNVRFTIDGSDDLEMRLAKACDAILAGVREIIPKERLEALVLGGGYGRGHGGVLKTSDGDAPYNDLEFYVFVRGNLFLAQRRHRAALHELGERLSPAMGLHVEFKVDSLEKLRRSPATMYSHDLVTGHKIIFGEEALFNGCEHHLAAGQIPAGEATRLLFNRCSGLLLVRDSFRLQNLDAEQYDFIRRNLAKAQLGLGDSLLTQFGQYHWDCRERHQRLQQLKPIETLPCLAEICRHHAEGVDFKLHPKRTTHSRSELELQFAELHHLSRRVWLWVESRRLDHAFESPREYALSDLPKCDGTSGFRNCLLNLKTFGPRAPLGTGFLRYPRERLFEALCLLFWDEEAVYEAPMLSLAQKKLQAKSTKWEDLISAYQRLWQNYG